MTRRGRGSNLGQGARAVDQRQNRGGERREGELDPQPVECDVQDAVRADAARENRSVDFAADRNGGLGARIGVMRRIASPDAIQDV